MPVQADNLRDHFQQAYPHFMEELRQMIDEITPHEEYVCLLLVSDTMPEALGVRYGLSDREYKRICGHLKKKMHLDAGDSLKEALAGIFEYACRK